MKIQELDWTDGRQYEDDNGMIWEVDQGEMWDDDCEYIICNRYTMKEILEMDFKSVN